MSSNLEMALALASGIVVAAACGLRAFLPLLFVGLAGRLGWIPLHDGVRWLSSTPALVCFGAAALFEIAGDKLPVVDHALDAVGTVVRPAAAWLAGFAVLAHWPSPWAQIAAVVLGGGALAVHAAKAKTRIGSSALTLGHLNPALSAAEDGTTLGLLAISIIAPVLAVVLLVLLVVVLLRWRQRRRRTAGGTVNAAS